MFKKLYFLVLGILCFILLLPIIGITSKIDFTFDYLLNFFDNKYNIKIIYISFLQAFLSALLSCFIAIPFALSLYRHKNLKIIKFIISICGYSFVLPPILVVYSVIGIYGINGFLNNLTNFYDFLGINSIFGLKAILVAHILLNAPFATRILFNNLNSIPKNYIDISSSLNLGFWSNILKIEWPIIKQNIFTVFSIIFVLCFLSFAIVMALGGGPSTSTMEVAIYQSALFELNFNKAIIISFIQIIICLIFLIFGFYNLKGSNFFEIQLNYFDHPFEKYYFVKLFDYLIIFILSTILFLPILYIIKNFLEVLYVKNIFVEKYFLNAFINSLILSFLTGIIVTFIGLITSIVLINSRKNLFLQQILFLTSSMILIISPVIISLGYFIILGEFRYFSIITYIVVIIINCLFLLPFSIIILFSRIKNIFLNYEDLKKTFRISEKNFIKIIFPLIKKNIIFTFSFSVAISFGDFTIISFFKNESFQTLPSILYKLIISYRFEEASFVAGFILVFSLIIYLLFDTNYYKDMPDNNK